MLLVLDMVIYLFALFGLFCPLSGIGYFPYGVSFRQLVAVVQCGMRLNPFMDVTMQDALCD